MVITKAMKEKKNIVPSTIPTMAATLSSSATNTQMRTHDVIQYNSDKCKLHEL